MQLAEVVRDLTWRGEGARLTKSDSDFLRQGLELLAAEMALVSGSNLSDSSKLITSTLATAVGSAAD